MHYLKLFFDVLDVAFPWAALWVFYIIARRVPQRMVNICKELSNIAYCLSEINSTLRNRLN